MAVGRPDLYTPELGDYIAEQIASGKSIRTICAPDDMPAISTIYRWLRVHPLFSEQYAKAKEDQADAMVEEMLDIADDTDEDVKRSRLKVDTRKWLASKFKAKKFGDSAMIKHADADGGNLSLSAILGAIDGRSASIPEAEK
jgi:hypothetical protein